MLIVLNMGCSNTFYILGAAYFIIIFCSAQYLAPPKAGWVPKGLEAAGKKSGGMKLKKDLQQLTANEAVKTRQFCLALWISYLSILRGLIFVASPMAQELVGMSAAGRSNGWNHGVI